MLPQRAQTWLKLRWPHALNALVAGLLWLGVLAAAASLLADGSDSSGRNQVTAPAGTTTSTTAAPTDQPPADEPNPAGGSAGTAPADTTNSSATAPTDQPPADEPNPAGGSAGTDGADRTDEAEAAPGIDPTDDPPPSPIPNDIDPTGADAPPSTLEARLAFAVDQIEQQADDRLPHLKWSLSVEVIENATAGNDDPATAPIRASFNEQDTYVSASTAKVFWLVAAVAEVGVEPVAPLSRAVLCHSDNIAAAEVINLVGMDAINEYLHNTAGMSSTLLLSWAFGENPPERASEFWRSQAEFTSNSTSTADAASFYAQLYSGQLLSEPATATVLGWLAEFSRCGSDLARPLSPQLPADATLLHKAGWLPPNCCRLELASLHDFGIAAAPEATYAIALASQGGAIDPVTYLRQIEFLSFASCEVLDAFRETDLTCEFDPNRRDDSGQVILPPTAPAPEPDDSDKLFTLP